MCQEDFVHKIRSGLPSRSCYVQNVSVTLCFVFMGNYISHERSCKFQGDQSINRLSLLGAFNPIYRCWPVMFGVKKIFRLKFFYA